MADDANERGPVTTLATPIRLDFDFTPGGAQSTFLRGLARGEFLGQRCPDDILAVPVGDCHDGSHAWVS